MAEPPEYPDRALQNETMRLCSRLSESARALNRTTRTGRAIIADSLGVIKRASAQLLALPSATAKNAPD